MNVDSNPLEIAGLQLHSEGPQSKSRPVVAGDSVLIAAGARADMFLDPAGSDSPPDAERFVHGVEGDFQFSAYVEANFQVKYDSGVLLGYVNDNTWFKICAELDPDGTPRVVTVVTKMGSSDDANSWPIVGDGIHLRISRMGSAFAMHASNDGTVWSMIRYFSLGQQTPNTIKVGLLTQSPSGDGTTARFSQITLSHTLLTDVRGGD